MFPFRFTNPLENQDIDEVNIIYLNVGVGCVENHKVDKVVGFQAIMAAGADLG